MCTKAAALPIHLQTCSLKDAKVHVVAHSMRTAILAHVLQLALQSTMNTGRLMFVGIIASITHTQTIKQIAHVFLLVARLHLNSTVQ